MGGGGIGCFPLTETIMTSYCIVTNGQYLTAQHMSTRFHPYGKMIFTALDTCYTLLL